MDRNGGQEKVSGEPVQGLNENEGRGIIEEKIRLIVKCIDDLRDTCLRNTSGSPTATSSWGSDAVTEDPKERENAPELVKIEEVERFIDALAVEEKKWKSVESAEWPEEGNVTAERELYGFKVSDFPTGICRTREMTTLYCWPNDRGRRIDGGDVREDTSTVLPLNAAHAAFFSFHSLQTSLQHALSSVACTYVSDPEERQKVLEGIAMDYLLATKILLTEFQGRIDVKSPLRIPEIYLPDREELFIDDVLLVHHSLRTGIIRDTHENRGLLASARTEAKFNLMCLMLKEPMPKCVGASLSSADIHELKNLSPGERGCAVAFLHRLLESGYLSTAKDVAVAIGETMDTSHISAATVMDCLKSAPAVHWDQIAVETEHIMKRGTSQELLQLARFLYRGRLLGENESNILSNITARMSHEDGNAFIAGLLPQRNENPSDLVRACCEVVNGGVSQQNLRCLKIT